MASGGGSASATSNALEERLDAGARALDLVLSALQRRQLLDYLGLLLRWNTVYNLTSVRDPLDMMAVHLLDSLSILPLVQAVAPRRILDVGSGAGLPGIPLAIALPDVQVQLIDAVAKKVSFLRHVATTLSLTNIVATHLRIEALTLAKRPDLIVSRAFSDLAKLVASVDEITDAATTLIAMKGAVPHAEIAGIVSPWRVSAVHPLDVPFLGAERCAVILKRDV